MECSMEMFDGNVRWNGGWNVRDGPGMARVMGHRVSRSRHHARNDIETGGQQLADFGKAIGGIKALALRLLK